ncbi:MAG: ribonuclease P protein component [Calditerrivibrio sp.]|nr:ribonuclease P protein component [Calditerrivibrio sp.]
MSTLRSEDFGKNLRLRKFAEFKLLFSKGKKHFSKYFCIYYKEGIGRIGIVVGKKVSKSAVDRNLIKRRIRHIFRTNKELFSDLDVVVVAQPLSLYATYGELLEDVRESFKKIRDCCD